MNNNDNILSGNEVSTIQVNSQIDTVESMIVEHSKSYKNTFEGHSQEYTDFVEHPYVLTLPNWTTANAIGARQVVSEDIWLAYRTNALTGPLGNKLKNFYYMEGVMRVTYVVQGSSFAAGKLVIAFDPDPSFAGQPAPAEVWYPGRCRIFQIPHIVIDPSKTATYTIDLPCPSPYGVWCAHLGEDDTSTGSYQVSTTVVNPLISGTAVSPTIQMVGYYQMVNPKLEGLSYTLTSLKVEKTSRLSDVFSKTADVSKTLSGFIPAFSGELNLFSNVSRTAAEALRWFGFSKGPVQEIDRVRVTGTNNYACIDGRVMVDSLTLRTNNSVGVGDDLCPLLSKDDQTVSYLCAKPGFVDTIPIPFATAAGALLRTIYITPLMTYDEGYVDASLEITPLGFCAYPYRFWRGDIDVDIDIVASVFHRATLVVIYEPYVVQNNDSVQLKMQVNKHWTFYVSGNSSTRITLPWRQPTPWKTLDKPLVPSAFTEQIGVEQTNGYLRFYLLNTVTSNGSTDPIFVNVFYSSKNIMFSQVADHGKVYEPVYYFTSGREISKTMGEEHAHTIKELASRATCFVDFFCSNTMTEGNHYFDVLVENSVSLFNHFSEPNATTLSYEPNNLLSFLAFAYVGNRGAITYHVMNIRSGVEWGIPSVEDCSGPMSVSPVYGFNNGIRPDAPTWGACTFTNGTLEPNLSFTSPQYVNGAFRTFEIESGTGELNHFHLVLPFYVRANEQLTGVDSHIQIFRQAGDDFQFVGFRGCPRAVYI